ncbi:hypothetical protein BOTBODRAFT_420368 [Botryobasidium botryosum FD-172 SS1]|uniref:Uncharacterized protein n=1 Tax=Botryobasidium botryosum (strain FD-172 SS1) TaxID=930990 RepID=A0A067MC79_BOTB1|nr:hypothetical protein BOTBODRAFT_420368 [Botryobasidium botryosum FD-172 SS1]
MRPVHCVLLIHHLPSGWLGPVFKPGRRWNSVLAPTQKYHPRGTCEPIGSVCLTSARLDNLSTQWLGCPAGRTMRSCIDRQKK